MVGAEHRPGNGTTTRRLRRMPGLLSLTATTEARGEVWITFPDGTRHRVGDAPTEAARVGLVGEPVRLVEAGPGAHLDDAPAGAAWAGGTLRAGGTVLAVQGPTTRCAKVPMAQPGLPFRARLPGEIEEGRGGCLGAFATVASPGALRQGDALTLGRAPRPGAGAPGAPRR